MARVEFSRLGEANLIVDATYESDRSRQTVGSELLIERAGLSSRANAIAWLSKTYPYEHGQSLQPEEII